MFSRVPSFMCIALLFVALLLPSTRTYGRASVGKCLHGGCDIVWHFNKSIDKGLRTKFTSVFDPAAQAFKSAMDDLRERTINPTIAKINEVTTERLDQIDLIVEKAIENAQKATTLTIEVVKREIIEGAREELIKVITEISTQFDCSAIKISNMVERLITFRLSAWFDGCTRQVDWSNATSVYRGLKCSYDRKIADSRTVDEIKWLYLEFLQANSQHQCLIGREPANLADTQQHALEYRNRLELWKLALTSRQQ